MYRLFSTEVEYGGVKQRWIVVFSEKAFTREKKTLGKRIKKKMWKYHKVKGIEVVEKRKKKGGGRGRPKNGEDLQCFYHIKAGFEDDEGAIKREMLRKGKFIVATNELDCEKLSDEEALKAYREHQHVERGFRFLKDPFFFANSMFLENEDRIVAMVMVMGLAFMGYSLAEKKLREAIEKEGYTIPDQRNKKSQKTMSLKF